MFSDNNSTRENLGRRSFLKKSVLVTGVAGLSFEERTLLAHQARAAESKPAKKNEPIKGLPRGKFGNLEISRVIIGTNPFGGGAHAGNHMYVSQLMKRYFTDEKVQDTLQLCEENGINTSIGAVNAIKQYNRERGGNMRYLAQLDPGHHDWSDDENTDGRISITKEDVRETVERAAEQGCRGGHLLGSRGDRWVKVGRLDMIEAFVSCMHKNGMLAGIGGHDIRVPMACERAGIKCDYYFKTIHPESYWGALSEEQKKPFLVDSFGPDDHDCMWEQWPQETIAFMKAVKTPWIGFKVLGAGAIHPDEGFEFAFAGGADFVCAGMFDWQVRENVRIAREILSEEALKQRRQRPWRA